MLLLPNLGQPKIRITLIFLTFHEWTFRNLLFELAGHYFKENTKYVLLKDWSSGASTQMRVFLLWWGNVYKIVSVGWAVISSVQYEPSLVCWRHIQKGLAVRHGSDKLLFCCQINVSRCFRVGVDGWPNILKIRLKLPAVP